MMRPHEQRRHGRPALELIEEAVHLLRRAPLAILASYFLGGLPFILGLLYFWADMSRGAFAYQRCAGAALGMAALFIWMKTWQAIFARQLRDQLTGRSRSADWRRWARVAVVQTALQPSALFLLPMAALVMLPFGWVYAFYQNVTALSDGETREIKSVFRRAATQSGFWPLQNHVIILVLFLFGLFVFLNLAIGLTQIPALLKTLLGIETVFSLSADAIFNTTFLAVVVGLTYLCVDPIIKTVYVLRCFYGESVTTGEDLKAELKGYSLATKALAMAGLLVGCAAALGASGVSLRGQEVVAGFHEPADFLPLLPPWEERAGERRAVLGETPLPDPLPRKQRGAEGIPSSRLCKADFLPLLPPWEERAGERRTVLGEPPLPDPLPRKQRGGEGIPSSRLREADFLPLNGVATWLAANVAVKTVAEPAVTNPSVPPAELDRSIEQVLGARKYTWRLPREKPPADEAAKGVIGRFIEAIAGVIKKCAAVIKEWVKAFIRWLYEVIQWLKEKLFGQGRAPTSKTETGDWVTGLQLLAFILFAIVLSGLMILFWRAWQLRRKTPADEIGQPVLPPDLADENVMADQLPEDGWLKLARDLIEQGELRLATRALYFASLAHLAQRELIGIAKFKSNRDYERELRRRARAWPELQTAFAENGTIFDRIWYGMHQVTADALNQFQGNFDKIKAC